MTFSYSLFRIMANSQLRKHELTLQNMLVYFVVIHPNVL